MSDLGDAWLKVTRPVLSCTYSVHSFLQSFLRWSRFDVCISRLKEEIAGRTHPQPCLQAALPTSSWPQRRKPPGASSHQRSLFLSLPCLPLREEVQIRLQVCSKMSKTNNILTSEEVSRLKGRDVARPTSCWMHKPTIFYTGVPKPSFPTHPNPSAPCEKESKIFKFNPRCFPTLASHQVPEIITRARTGNVPDCSCASLLNQHNLQNSSAEGGEAESVCVGGSRQGLKGVFSSLEKIQVCKGSECKMHKQPSMSAVVLAKI